MAEIRDIMEFNVPFRYEADVIEKGRRSFSTVSFFEWQRVQIPVFTDIEAPIACAWTPLGFNDQRLERETRRYIDGQFYKPLRLSFSKVHADLPSLKANSANRVRINPFQRELKDAYLDHVFENNRFDDRPDNYRAVQDSSYEQEMEKFSNCVANTVSIDGQLWIKTPEPILVVDFALQFVRTELRISVMETEEPLKISEIDNYRPDRLFRYPMSEYEEIEAFSEKLRLAFDVDGKVEKFNFEDLRIVAPEFFNADFANIDYKDFGTNVAEEYWGKIIDAKKEVIIAWCDLRDACNKAGEIPTENEATDIVEMMNSFFDKFGDDHFQSKVAAVLDDRFMERKIILPTFK